MALIDGALARDRGFEDARRRVAAWTAQDGSVVSHGRVARRIASKEYAGWPSFAGCAALFWRARAAVAAIDGVTPALFVRVAARR